jgi:HK97 family phage portal protein
MKIFGWKSAGRGSLRPVNTHVQLARAFGAPVLGSWPSSYEAQLREGYLNNAIAQRAVRLVAEGVASVPLTSSDASDGRTAAAALKLVKETSAGQDLMETVAAHVLLHGNAYIEVMRGDDGAPVELYALRPERVSVEADTRGWPVAFLYKAGQTTTRMAVENVIHIRTMHPLDDHYGLGCLGAASGAVAIHNAAAKWNKALLDNAARPSGALTYDTGDAGALSGEQFDRLRAELDASFAGAVNAGRPMLLEGGLKWQALSLSPADMDFVGLKDSAAREIALAFGVPPMLLGLPGDATYANYREASKALWRQAILPLACKILGAVAQGLSDAFPGLRLDIDLEQITALAEDRERLWAQLSAADFLTTDEQRGIAGFDPLKVETVPPARAKEPQSGVIELKYNPWHDNQNGQFTFARQGNFAGGGGTSGSRTSPAPAKPAKPDNFKPGGGSYGGGGTSGSWDKPKPQKPPAKPKQPKREIVKAPLSNVGRTALSKPQKQNVRTIKAGGYYFETDRQDRTVRASGQLRLQPDQRRSRSAQRDAGKPDRLPKDHGGHLIGRQFGGPETRYNHFAQNARFNNGNYRKLENDWKNQLKEGKKVRVDIQVAYSGNSKRPNRILVHYYVNGKFNERSFPN